MGEPDISVGSGSSVLCFYVNGQKIEDSAPDPKMTLLTYLRDKLRLTGSKLGCGEGGCGACTVMVSRYSDDTDTVKHYSVNACLAPVCSMHGLAVTTVEGIGNIKNIHPVQERIAKFHGSQCGFCTPGMVMSMYTLLRNNACPTVRELEEYLDGNLCRCTGYRAILDGFKTFTKVSPSDLKINHNKYLGEIIQFSSTDVEWIQPKTLPQLLALKKKYPTAKLLVGNTEIGVDTKFKYMKFPVLISTTNIEELSKVQMTEAGLVVGGAMTLSRLISEINEAIATQPDYKTGIFVQFVEMLKWFASHQIRNVASVAGNIMTASPISDLNPLLLACSAQVSVKSLDRGSRVLNMDKGFFCGYRKTAVASDEVLVSVTIPFTKKGEIFAGYKQANRKEDDISITNAGMLVELNDNHTINKLTLAFGGMGITTLLASQTMEAVIGDKWNDSLLSKVCDLLAKDLPLDPGAPGGSSEYRRTLALSFFFKFYVSVSQKLNSYEADISAIQPMENPTTRSIQVVGAVDSREKPLNFVGKSPYHISALQQSTGEAIYIDDMAPVNGELHLSLVTSTKPFAKILRVDPSEALASAGVVDFLNASDIPGVNHLDIVMDKIFEDNEVTCQGQVIGAIVATSHECARNAVRLVKVDYEAKSPVIITIKDAIKHNSYFNAIKKITAGDVETSFKSCDHILEGEVRMNAQNHFYMETMSTRAIPGENGEMEIFTSTQNPTDIQLHLASILGVDCNKVVVRTKRIGGGFGGKETQTLLSAAPTVIAARKLGRPIRCILERDEDMITTGNRHPFLAKYKVGFTSKGKILALDLELYNNGGNSLDLSLAVMEKALLEIDSSYHFPNMRLIGRVCKTNIMSNTAFRAFGGVQGHWIAESIMDDVIAYLDLDPVKARELNFFQPGVLTHYNFPAGGEYLKTCWDMCLEQSHYYRRSKEIEEYNRQNRWKKKGMCIIPIKFGISFLQTHMNQAGALVHVYRDGSVLIAHSGIEMGQGLHIKIAQVASEVFQLPLSYIHISETSTNTVPNTQPTAASVSTDLNGMAVKAACETIIERLKPFIKTNPKGSWEQWIKDAYLGRISLSATGFYRTPDVGYNMDKCIGQPFAYYTYGVACSIAQIDCLTGDHKLLSTDIVMDVGNSINPAIDVGQIEGAFVQGCGLMLLEDVKVNAEGYHLTRGPGYYKIPAFGNIPAEFNVSLVPDSPNPKAIFSSRGVGEPPLLLASSAFFAVKDAIRVARRENKENILFTLNSPALPANIRMACMDDLSKRFPLADPETYVPWTVDL
uniref:xanthine dehydrogenase n=1 Tax=Biomphalaria glabrata TaxID=6526 RepID=A0A2C9JEU6_BIOGL